MPAKNVLIRSLFIQSLGAGLGFLVAVIVAQRFGASAQGMLATARAWVDMASLVLLAGLPQALIHEVSSARLKARVAARLALTYAATASLVLWAGTTLITPLGPPFSEPHVRTMLVGAACLATVYGLMRVLILTSGRYLVYNLVSAAPSVLLVLGVLVIAIADPTRLALVLVAVFMGCSLMAIASVRTLLLAPVSEPLSPGNLLQLVQYGGWSFTQQVAAQAAILGCYMLLRVDGNVVVGHFSIVLVIVSVMTLPLNIIGPILFNRWTEEYTASRRTDHFVLAACGFFLLSVAATITGLPVIYVGVPLVFGEEFESALPACLAIGASTLLLVQRRVLSTAGLAFGMPRHCAIAETSRTVVTLVVLATHPTLGGAIVGWCAGEIVGLVMIAAALKRRLGIAYHEVLGMNRAAATNLLQYVLRRQHDL